MPRCQTYALNVLRIPELLWGEREEKVRPDGEIEEDDGKAEDNDEIDVDGCSRGKVPK